MPTQTKKDQEILELLTRAIYELAFPKKDTTPLISLLRHVDKHPRKTIGDLVLWQETRSWLWDCEGKACEPLQKRIILLQESMKKLPKSSNITFQIYQHAQTKGSLSLCPGTRLDIGHLPPLRSLSLDSMIDIIEEGLPISVFKEICSLMEISENRLSEVIRIPISTLYRRKKRGYFSATESERLLRILKLYSKAVDVFDNRTEYARKWLKEEAYGLDGAIPLEYAKTEIGAKEVEQLLTRIDEGMVA